MYTQPKTRLQSPWVKIFKPNPRARLRLFCLPYAGGGASAFRTWANDLPNDIEICAVQLPGRESHINHPPRTCLTTLVKDLTQALLPYLDRPFHLFGHSMGALISFELTRELRRQKCRLPEYLSVSGRYAPQLTKPVAPIHGLADDDFLVALRRFNGSNQALFSNAELQSIFLPILRADFCLLETYVYSPELPLSCPISVFGGTQDAIATTEDLQAWHDQTSAHATLQMFPGNHFFIKTLQADFLQAFSTTLYPSNTDRSI